MSNPTELPDLDKLEALARAATPGEWKAMPHGRVVGGPLRHYVNGSAKAQIASFSVTFHEQAPEDEPERQQANADFAAAANPEQVLALIALARRAQPEGEAPQAAPLSEVHIDRIARAYFSEQWAVQHAKDAIHDAFQDARKSASLSPLCGAQHAESGKEGAAIAAFKKWHEEVGDQDCEYTWLQAWTAAQCANFSSAPGTPEAPVDPLDTALPCDIKVGNGTIRKGCKLRTLVARMESLYRMAVAALPVVTPEQRVEFDSLFPRAAQLDGGQEGSESNG